MNEFLLKVKKYYFEPHNLALTSDVFYSKESLEYAAMEFRLHEKLVCFRVGKITPTKNGLFVTLWKRNEDGKIIPFAVNDPIDHFMIYVEDGMRAGLFNFPKDALVKQGIVSSPGKKGKLAIRLYPSWVIPESKQAASSQRWQTLFFTLFT